MTTDATFSAGVGARPGGPSAGPPSPAERCRRVARRFTALVDGGDLPGLLPTGQAEER
ncbi:hypothetical protein [Streptomyces sp. Isolate_219]|uniref:hypothetical protein n=1 Tax=Streptomyces sp. Isolate_219 TaxID=2950110 RepID=UPI0021CA279E|nr:hypothetical protein [Streptomyces sp. Isolate_219]MCR8575195.1 hypothetical protein [Streptomyces sp. Isolate_219]